ncbi:MAG: DUF4290 domain-containing protein [Prevotellaceae bacterium]|jgi:hypothetical protein|nr:DUF4290 domain-containing protein [Prevotellaceae bacterium]
MDYNTQRKKLVLPEYGRSIHKMVDWVRTIEDRGERNRQIRAVIAVMGNMNPHLRDVNDFKHKLWDHIQMMSDFRIDIDSPFPIPTRESFNTPIHIIPYASETIKVRHYGRNIQLMINRIAASANCEAREKSLLLLANHMKKSYVTWNKETVSDDIIFRDIEFLSGGKIRMPENTKLAPAYNLNLNPITATPPPKGSGASKSKAGSSSGSSTNKGKKK